MVFDTSADDAISRHVEPDGQNFVAINYAPLVVDDIDRPRAPVEQRAEGAGGGGSRHANIPSGVFSACAKSVLLASLWVILDAQ